MQDHFKIHAQIVLVYLSLFFFSFSVNAQRKDDSITEFKEVVITGFLPNSPKLTSLNIEPYSLKVMNEKSPFNLCDALAKLPGVSQMTTGNSIAKPIIRGLYGNRILISLSGLRFDNQQWQDEHGLGLSQIGINRVEVIKGPASLLYGSEAVGGVVNVIEEKPTLQGLSLDAGTMLFSNTRGTITDIGLSKRNQNRWWRLRMGYENQADYSDGGNIRVLNSRSNGAILKAGFGFERKKWRQENSYNFSYNQYGFILDDLLNSFSPDNRWNRSMAGPHHIVMLNLLNSQNTFQLKKSLLKLNVGVQSNSRREDEGGGQISLNMHLLSLLENLRLEKDIHPNWSLVINQQLNFTNNTNYGGRIIIPDANMLEGNLSGYLKFNKNLWIMEAGIGVNSKQIQTKLTRTLNASGQEIQPFTKDKSAANAMVGLAYNPTKFITFKTNLSSGFRAANLAELSSNGVHEGVYRYEIGDPNLKVEQNLNSDVSFEYNHHKQLFSASFYYNHFSNYIYLEGTSETKYTFPVYRFKQQDATLYGTEIMFVSRPSWLKMVEWKETFTLTRGELANGNQLPFIPAPKLNSSLRYEKSKMKNFHDVFIEPEFQYIFPQNNPAQFETSTPDYWLINLSMGTTLKAEKGNWLLGFVIKNATNKKYIDHLSRLKYYGLNNQGINIVFSVRKEIRWYSK